VGVVHPSVVVSDPPAQSEKAVDRGRVGGTGRNLSSLLGNVESNSRVYRLRRVHRDLLAAVGWT
jgi:hypothetical protein